MPGLPHQPRPDRHGQRRAPDHRPPRPRTREPRPYITIRPGLEARINRAVFYELVALAQRETVDGREMLGVWSEGVFFPIDEACALDAAAE